MRHPASPHNPRVLCPNFLPATIFLEFQPAHYHSAGRKHRPRLQCKINRSCRRPRFFRPDSIETGTDGRHTGGGSGSRRRPGVGFYVLARFCRGGRTPASGRPINCARRRRPHLLCLLVAEEEEERKREEERGRRTGEEHHATRLQL